MGKTNKKFGILSGITLSIFMMVFIFIGMNTKDTYAKDIDTGRAVTTITAVDGATSTVTPEGYVDINVEVTGTGLKNIKSTKLYVTDTTTDTTYKNSVQVTNFTETELDFTTEFKTLTLNHEYTVEYSMIANDDEEFRETLTSTASLEDETQTLENGDIVSLKTNENDEISFIKEGETTEITSVDGATSTVTADGYVDINVEVVGTKLDNLTSAKLITTDTTTGNTYRNSVQVTDFTDTELDFTTEFRTLKLNHPYTIEYEMIDISGQVMSGELTSTVALDESQTLTDESIVSLKTDENDEISFIKELQLVDVETVDGATSEVTDEGYVDINVDMTGTGFNNLVSTKLLTTDGTTGTTYKNSVQVTNNTDTELSFTTEFKTLKLDHEYSVGYYLTDKTGAIHQDIVPSSVALDSSKTVDSKVSKIYANASEQVKFMQSEQISEGIINSVNTGETTADINYDYTDEGNVAEEAVMNVYLGDTTSGTEVYTDSAVEGTNQIVTATGLELATEYTAVLEDSTGIKDTETFTTKEEIDLESNYTGSATGAQIKFDEINLGSSNDMTVKLYEGSTTTTPVVDEPLTADNGDLNLFGGVYYLYGLYFDGLEASTTYIPTVETPTNKYIFDEFTTDTYEPVEIQNGIGFAMLNGQPEDEYYEYHGTGSDIGLGTGGTCPSIEGVAGGLTTIGTVAIPTSIANQHTSFQITIDGVALGDPIDLALVDGNYISQRNIITLFGQNYTSNYNYYAIPNFIDNDIFCTTIATNENKFSFDYSVIDGITNTTPTKDFSHFKLSDEINIGIEFDDDETTTVYSQDYTLPEN